MPGDGEAETRSADTSSVGRGVRLAEGFEKAPELLGGHADPGVADPANWTIAVGPVALDRKREAALLGEFAGIAQDVEQALLQASCGRSACGRASGGTIELERISRSLPRAAR